MAGRGFTFVADSKSMIYDKRQTPRGSPPRDAFLLLRTARAAKLCEKPYRTTDPTTKVATKLKWMLLKLYRPQVAFELRVTTNRPKSRMGYYVPAKRSLTIHGGWGDVHSLEEIAIHEYAHHIHFTEHRRSGKKDAPHGQNF